MHAQYLTRSLSQNTEGNNKASNYAVPSMSVWGFPNFPLRIASVRSSPKSRNSKISEGDVAFESTLRY
ncbi:uncharacterized protein PHALS_13195 [Plasmopara halstedii]|uniref:Uncharacterized protein n=1 Tax=Plasmopara halstedii TaxID=4781 RepID=A0A0P1ANX7_PLAHL|nr:uncharacterized protein PHALS_13195 [Plasmopara halstedii]CEG42962.1 hypothetical protein PHALS_13195 [Plasmopara halstedii]|eukprot:XP_024579331.1 hypothetical protein PHALS_13195 [Plasmopara halstedii]